MKTLTYSEASQNLAKTLDEIIENHSPVKIIRTRGKGDVVIMSLKEYESFQETFYLLKTPKNATRLLKAIKRLKRYEDYNQLSFYPINK